MPISLIYGSDHDERAGAVLSPCRTWRYALERRWGKGPFVMFLMLNPSKADERRNDNTIVRCMDFAERWGAGGLLVGNLFAFRATKPADLARAEDPVGPDCDVWLTTMALRSFMIVAAWGSQPRVADRVDQVIELVGKEMLCLGHTKNGSPRHPVRLAKATSLTPWP
jgi:hypothetical protein